MAVLVISELLAYIKVDTSSHMAVADFHEHDAVTARLHATFPFVECQGQCDCGVDGQPAVSTAIAAPMCFRCTDAVLLSSPVVTPVHVVMQFHTLNLLYEPPATYTFNCFALRLLAGTYRFQFGVHAT